MRIDLVPASRVFAVSALLAALASCGGGGGGGGSSGPTPTLALTASNAQNVGGDALLASVQTPSKSTQFVPLSTQPQQQALRQTLVLSRFLQEQLTTVRPQRQALSAVVPAAAQTVQCQSGDITIVSDASSATETFNACSNAPGVSVSGVVTIAGFASGASSFSASVSVSLTFSATGFPDQVFSGSFGISETGVGGTAVTFTISGSNLTLQQGSNTQNLGSFTLSTTVDTSASGTTESVSFGYSSTEIGGTVVVTTLTPFQIASGKTFPHAGVLQITGINGSSLRVTVNGDESAPAPQVTIQLDANGDGVFELTLDKNWSDFN